MIELPVTAAAIDRWGKRNIATMQGLIETTEALVQSEIRAELLRGELAAVAVGPAIDAAHESVLAAELAVAHEAIARLEGELADRERRLAELSAEWEEQGARIMALEGEIAGRPSSCPVCGESLDSGEATVPRAEPEPDPLPWGWVLKPCWCCKEPAKMRTNGQYCELCRDPKTREARRK